MTDAGVCDPAEFLWPEEPLNESWWALKGAMKRMPDDYVRFAAAAWRIGGRSNKKHLAAAKLAGLKLGRTEAYRVSATTAVRWLLAEAERVAKGQEPPLTEREIENELARMVRSGDPQVVAKAIELRDRREQRKLEQLREPAPNLEDLTREILSIGDFGPQLVLGLFFQMIKEHGRRVDVRSFPLFEQLAPVLSKRHPDIWWKLLLQLDGDCRRDADRLAAGSEVPIEAIAGAMSQQSMPNPEAADAGG